MSRIQLLFLHSSNRSFPSCILCLCQNESKCETTHITSDHRFIFMQQSFARRLVCTRKHLTMSWLTGAFDFSLCPIKGELGYKFVEHLEGWSRPFWFYEFCFGSVFFLCWLFLKCRWKLVEVFMTMNVLVTLARSARLKNWYRSPLKTSRWGNQTRSFVFLDQKIEWFSPAFSPCDLGKLKFLLRFGVILSLLVLLFLYCFIEIFTIHKQVFWYLKEKNHLQGRIQDFC